MLSNGYNRACATKTKTVDVVKRELQYDIIEHWQKVVAKMSIEELKLYIKMNNVESY